MNLLNIIKDRNGSKKFFIPETFLDENDKLIDDPKAVISSFNVKIGDIIKEGNLLCNLDLITKEMSFICPIYSSAEDNGYISDIFETNEVKVGSAIFIIDAQKQSSKNGRLKLIKYNF